MQVVGRKLLKDFGDEHADVVFQLSSWLREAENAQWRCPKDIKARYAHASFLSNNRIIFNLKGNHYRLQAKVNFAAKVVLIERIGTHAEYSKWTF